MMSAKLYVLTMIIFKWAWLNSGENPTVGVQRESYVGLEIRQTNIWILALPLATLSQVTHLFGG